MARIKFAAAAGMFGAALSFDFGTAFAESLSATAITLVDGTGARLVLEGSGLEIAPGPMIFGQVQGLQLFAPGGALQAKVGGIDYAAMDLVTMIETLEFEDLYLALTKGRDHIVGGGAADLLVGGQKADVIDGNGGRDAIMGLWGDDTLTGGGGVDTFFFRTKGDGHDTITDFSNSTGFQEDRIAIERAAYLKMVVTEDAGGVLLTFSDTSSVYVEGWTAAEVGRNDFVFV